MFFLFLFFSLFSTLTASENLPPVTMATVRTAVVPLPVIKLPVIPLPVIELPEISTVTFLSDLSDLSDKSDQSDTSLAIGTVPVAKVAVTTAADLAAAKAHREAKNKLFRDRRGLQYDATTGPESSDFAAWIELYKSHTPYMAAHVPLRKGLRMVAELRHPADPAVLADNLQFYRSKGYNAVLITFDGSEEPYHLTDLADKVAAAGFKVWYAFGGAEDLKLSVFVHPGKLRRLIAAIAPRAEGALLNWRRTSQHLLLPDRPFTDFFIKEGRTANPQLQLVGESYFGHNAESNHKFKVATSSPANASGVLLVNVGYSFYSPESIFSKLFGHLAKVPKLVVILGPRPYYATRGRSRFSFEPAWEIKRLTEENFLRAGAAGTVTLHGDGSNGIYNKSHTDNIGHTARN